MKKTLLAMSILLGLLGFSACGEASSRTVYQYRETEVFQNFYVKKAVYTPGELKLYYRGGAFKDNQKLFNAYWCGPPSRVTGTSSWPSVDHLVSLYS